MDSFPVHIALNGWGPGADLFIAANAQIRLKHGRRKKYEVWGDGTSFPRGWNATYFNYKVQASAPPSCANGASCTVFVTGDATFYTGDLGGLAGADATGAAAKCQARAADGAGLGGTYRAWLSDNTGSPSIGFTQAGVPYVMPNGTQIAANWGDLTDGSIAAFLNIDETGGGVTAGIQVWTNTKPGGTLFSTTETCSNWTSADSTFGFLGGIDVTNARWTGDDDPFGPLRQRCQNPRRVYCFEQ